jgi:RNA polymerase sigma-70 factor (ECF subfamily)
MTTPERATILISMPSPDDLRKSRIIRQLMEGRNAEENFRALFETYYPAVRAYFARRGFSPEDCRDLAQDVFVAVHAGIGTLQEEESFVAWLFSIARHIGVRHFRRTRSSALAVSTAGEGVEFDLPSPDPSPLGAILDREKTEVVRAALEELPERMRECLRGRLVDELNYRQIGARMGISENTVAVQIHRAMKTMRTHLKAFFAEEPLEEDF